MTCRFPSPGKRSGLGPLALALVMATSQTLSTVSPARAQGAAATEDATTKIARSRFKEGVQFFDKGDFENARAAFLQAYALKKHPAVLLNLAQSSLRSGHGLEAARYFQQFLREAQNISPQQREAATAGLGEARTKLGRIEVVAPAGAEISMDGERIGTAPLAEAADVEPGAHVVAVRVDGKEEQQNTTVPAGQKSVVKFAGSSSTAAPVPPPPVTVAAPTPSVSATATAEAKPPPVPATPSTTETAPSENAKPKEEEPKAKSSGPVLETTVPIWVGAGIGVVGFASAVVFGLARQAANSNALQVEAAIKANITADEKRLFGNDNPPICSSRNPTIVNKYGRDCTQLAENRNTVNTDATLANIGLIVGAAGVVIGAGWYFFGPRKEESKTGHLHHPSTFRATLQPLVDRERYGLMMTGRF